MVVYIEDCLIENFFVTLLIFLCINKIFNIKPSKKRIILVCLLSGIVACFYPLCNLEGVLLILFKLCLGVILVYLNYKSEKLLAKYIAFVLLTGLYAGLNILIYYFVYGSLNIIDNFATHMLLAILFTIYFLINSCLKLMKKNFVISNFIFDIKIINDNEVYKDVAFLDSGNTLIDEQSGMPVLIINAKLFKKLYKNINFEDILLKKYKNLKSPHYIKSGFASGSGKILVFSVDSVQIISNNNFINLDNAVLGLVYSKFDKNFNCNMLLNMNTFAYT